MDVLASGTEASAEIIKFVLVIRRTAAGRRGAGGCWVAAAVAAAGVGAYVEVLQGAVHRQGCDRPHAAQVPAVLGVHGQVIDRMLDISVVLREGTHSANCAEDRALVSTSL